MRTPAAEPNAIGSGIRAARARRALILLVAVASGTAGAAQADRGQGGFVTVSGDRFIDAAGRGIILHGANVVDKTADFSATPWLSEGSFASMRTWGFNCIRLAFTWASLEPSPGEYSERCLAELDRRVDWARRNGLYVFLDMHQDLFSIRFSDGAPEWATLTDGKPHIAEGDVWSDAYLTSPAVQAAMDNFYANRPGPGGVGLQDRYARAWRRVAEHFAGNPAVVGYDLMNEPFAGSLVPRAMYLMAARLAQEPAARDGAAQADAPGILREWGSPAGRGRILALLEDPVLYGRVLDAAQPLLQEFDRTSLTPLFQRVTDSIRQVDRSHIIFLETGGSSNMGVLSAIGPMRGPGGGRDPLQAYAPHGYDLVTDTPAAAAASGARVELIFERHGRTARRLGMPMLVGEWGAYYGNARALGAAQVVCRQFERLLCGDTYWALERDLDSQPAFQAICRPYPMCVTGRLLSYSADPQGRTFACEWREDPAAAGESRIFIPQSYGPTRGRVMVRPAGSGFRIERVGPGSGNAYVVVPPMGRERVRRLTVE
jgi:endoglycosylceramidase